MRASHHTNLIPLPHAVMFLEESLVMGHAVLAVDEATRNRSALKGNGIARSLARLEGVIGWTRAFDLPCHSCSVIRCSF